MKNGNMGIDPGLKGGIAIIFDDCLIVRPYSEKDLIDLCYAYCTEDYNMVCALEQVHAMPGQGVTSMFNFGKNFGYIKGVLETCGIPYQEIPPIVWKRHFSLGSDKLQSIEVAHRLFPDTSFYPTSQCKKESDGMAEALLIAEYGRRKFK